MAETVLSMARSMLGSAISKAAAAAAEEMSLLMGVQKEIWFMKDELKTMQAFLIAAEAMKKKDLLLKVWAEQVRSLSYDIEDCLDEFMVHVGRQSLFQNLMKLKDRHRIAVQIRNLKARVEEVSSRNTRYNLISMDASNAICEVDSYMEDVRNNSANNIAEAELVGFDTPKRELLDKINVNINDGHARVICVVGMGGLGKTTLVRKTYESKEDIAKNFSCCAWITVSQSFSKTELLKDMIKQLLGNRALDACLKELGGKAEDLASYLRQGLDQKRYFTVLDDLWNIHDWKWISSNAFPSNNNKGSRIIVTTRENGLAETCTSKPFIYYLKPLEEECAIDLLLRKMGKCKEDMENDKKLKNIVTKLVKKCGRLPLAILTIGALFGSTHVSEWENLFKQLPLELESNPNLEAMRRMVTLSYSHLPSYLKPCFLYLSIFPEDSEIKRMRLVDRWIAERFVRARVGKTIEDVGESYFDELISRSMTQPSRVNIEGRVKSCRVHDIMRDIVVSISREENFVYSLGDNVPRTVEENFRHVACHGGKYPTVGMDWSRVRSLTFFGERPMGPGRSLCSPQLRMLRTLDLENAEFRFTQKEINNIGLLRHLKYLNVGDGHYRHRHSNIYELPRSIGKLQCLQALDIRNSQISTLPNEISKLQSLRSLRCSNSGYYKYFNLDEPKDCMMQTLCIPTIFMPLVDSGDRDIIIADLHMAFSSRWSKSRGVRVPTGFSKLKDLQILELVDIRRTSTKAIEELGELIQLRKLRVTIKGAAERKCKAFYKAIQKLSSLRSLSIDDEVRSGTGTLESLGSAFSPPPLLKNLRLSGYIGGMPEWFSSLTQLVKIYLDTNKLTEGKTMELLRALPKLMILRLYMKVHVGKELVFREGAFPCLRKLEILGMEQLRGMRFEEGASPEMESIIIYICKLTSRITGIKHLPRLKEISLNGLGARVARLGTLEEEVNGHPNPTKPVLRLQVDRRFHDLGEVEGYDVQVQAIEPVPDHAQEDSQEITLTSTATEPGCDCASIYARPCLCQEKKGSTTLFASSPVNTQYTLAVRLVWAGHAGHPIKWRHTDPPGSVSLFVRSSVPHYNCKTKGARRKPRQDIGCTDNYTAIFQEEWLAGA
ncbi:unnamed protein product [Urochloa decumbens]|uniref:Disease resistance protein RPM1 n=1 Tax=Urochloa decumbens TaxID=240449 RepID=A0ABC9DPP5_9POAL